MANLNMSSRVQCFSKDQNRESRRFSLKMQSKILLIVFLVTQINFLNVVKFTSACTESAVSQESQESQDEDPIEIYKNFTDTIFATISELGENHTETNVEIYEDDGSSSIASLIGVSYILAGASDLQWPISYPAFDNVLQTPPQDILGALDFVFGNPEQTLKCENVIFVSASLNLSIELETGKKNSFEIIPVDFDEDDVTVPIINDKISRLKRTGGSIHQNYIPEGLLISSSTVAMLFNTVETGRLEWDTPWRSIGKRTFNKREQVEMLQFQGNVQFIEDESEIQLFLFFQNRKCGLALRMSKDVSDHQSVANIEDIDLATSTLASVQLPFLNYTLRSEYNFNQDNTTNCEFEKNYLQLLDVLAHVHLGPDYFQFVAISGAQINNVELYKEEVRRDKENNIPKTQFQNIKSSNPKSPKSEENLAEPEYLDVDEGGPSSAEQVQPLIVIPNQSPNGTKELEEGEEKDMKKIILDRPFTWMFFDDHRVPIVAGVVATVAKTASSSVDEPQGYSYLGMEGSRSFPYIQCFCTEC